MGSHPVFACRVDCPIRGRIEVDQCFGCLRFRAVVPAQSGFAIRCDAPFRHHDRQTIKGGFVVRSW